MPSPKGLQMLRDNPDLAYKNPINSYVYDLFGYTQKRNAQRSVQTQIDYNDYLKGAYERQYRDWQRNVGSKGRTIKYPELSYPGQMYRTDTSSARAMYDYANAEANYRGNFLFRGAGLYGVLGRVSRTL